MDIQTPPPLGEHLRSPRLRSAMLVQQEAMYAAREFLRGAGFVELLPPLVGPVTDPGGRGAKALDVDYYGEPYKLMTSAILYKQASLGGFPRLFYIAPNVRVEPPETAATGSTPGGVPPDRRGDGRPPRATRSRRSPPGC